MELLDWFILVAILGLIVGYGVWKSKSVKSARGFLVGEKNLKWWTIGLSVMATQASAITFLSTPGQAYEEGMGFAQFYFGLPIAMVLLCIFVLPIFYKLKVHTAYEYLEGRFDLKTRTLTASLFLVARGLAAGITIFAPSIILSSILGWSLGTTTLLIGFLVIVYTVTGGSEAVSQTQKQQMVVILLGMAVAFIIILNKLPEHIGLDEAMVIAGQTGRLDIVNFEFDLSEKYNIWSALLGGTFLFLSYFGTDQSQVQRYLAGKSLTESRLGLLFNGLFKVPMQFGVLFVGLMVFIFFQFNTTPLHFNDANVELIQSSAFANEYQTMVDDYHSIGLKKEAAIYDLLEQREKGALPETGEGILGQLMQEELSIKKQSRELIDRYNEETGSDLNTEDADYMFISFIMNHLPTGLVGLLLAVIFSAAMSTTASELNALATTSVIDIYKRSFVPDKEDQHYLKAGKWMTVLWGVIALLFAMMASLFDNLIEAVNMIGSLFYGTILGIFAVAFFFKKVKGDAVFWAAILVELFIILLAYLKNIEVIELSYLWLNMIGCLLVILFANVFNSKQKNAL